MAAASRAPLGGTAPDVDMTLSAADVRACEAFGRGVLAVQTPTYDGQRGGSARPSQQVVAKLCELAFSRFAAPAGCSAPDMEAYPAGDPRRTYGEDLQIGAERLHVKGCDTPARVCAMFQFADGDGLVPDRPPFRNQDALFRHAPAGRTHDWLVQCLATLHDDGGGATVRIVGIYAINDVLRDGVLQLCEAPVATLRNSKRLVYDDMVRERGITNHLDALRRTPHRLPLQTAPPRSFVPMTPGFVPPPRPAHVAEAAALNPPPVSGAAVRL